MPRRTATLLTLAAVAYAGATLAAAAPAPVAVSRAQAAQVYAPGDGVTPPAVVREVRPEYTAEAKANRIQGSVLLSVVVQTDGSVGAVEVTRSLDDKYGLDQAAVAAARKWEFKPGTKDGKPVPVRVTLELTFTLK